MSGSAFPNFGTQGGNSQLPGPLSAPQNHQLLQVQPVVYRASDWTTRTVPAMRWIVEDWIPRQQVTGLYGAAGTLKTWLLLQVLMAKAAGLVVLGQQMDPEPTLGVFCEDTPEEIVRRKEKIARFYGRSLDDFADFHWVSLVGVENTELVTFDAQALMLKTDLVRWLDYYILKYQISVAGLDTVAHMFGGEEVKRREVAPFIRFLDAISITRDCAIVFTAHPSVRGRQSGTMDSGSTHWEGGVRSRLTFHDPSTVPNAAPADPDLILRVLTRVKANYAPAGEKMELVWRDRLAFSPAVVDPTTAQLRQPGPGRDAAVGQRFVELLKTTADEGRPVSATDRASNYAPKVFADHPNGMLFSKAEYARAMARLLANKIITVQPYGPPSKDRRKIVLAADGEGRPNGKDKAPADRSWQRRQLTKAEREQVAANAARVQAEQDWAATTRTELPEDEQDDNETQPLR
jgi:RecA-family ATPase